MVRSARQDPCPPGYPLNLRQPLPAPMDQSSASSPSLSCRPPSMTDRFCVGPATVGPLNIANDIHGDPGADTTDVRHESHADETLRTPGPFPDGQAHDRRAAISDLTLGCSPRRKSWSMDRGLHTRQSRNDDPLLPRRQPPAIQCRPLLSKRRASRIPPKHESLPRALPGGDGISRIQQPRCFGFVRRGFGAREGFIR